MSLTRRQLLAGVAGLAGGLILPPTLAENAEEARRWWALGGVPGYGPWQYSTVSFNAVRNDPIVFCRVRGRATLTGWEEHIDWVNPDYASNLRITRAPGGGFLMDFVGDGDA